MALAAAVLIFMAARSWFILLVYYLDVSDQMRSYAVLTINVITAAIVAFICASPVTHVLIYVEGTQVRALDTFDIAVHALLAVELVCAVACGAWARAKMSLIDRQRVFLLAFYPVALIAFSILGCPLPGVSYLAPGATFALVVIYIGYLDTLISTDPLTGLNNRYLLFNHVRERMKAGDGDVSLFMVDVNGFKHINDTYGHLEGDRALAVVTRGLKRAIADEPNAFLARYGGDEFTIVANVVPAEEESFAARVRESVVRAAQKAGVAYPLTVSVGASHMGADARTSEELFALADANLYKAKRANKGEHTQDGES
ncbi:MAG: GGDEF domain-containing protein [Eggerthellaceae bacterium]|nr:GGDEF domain-containing protein [Eggerthellaceae bacterium]